MAILGIGNPAPIFSMVPAFGPFKPAGLLPTITEEDKVILNNVQTVVEFLTAGSSISRTSNQVFTYKFLRSYGIYFDFAYVPYFNTNSHIVTCVMVLVESAGCKCCSGCPRASSVVAGHFFDSTS